MGGRGANTGQLLQGIAHCVSGVIIACPPTLALYFAQCVRREASDRCQAIISVHLTSRFGFTFSMGNCPHLVEAYAVQHSLCFGGSLGFLSTVTTRYIITTCFQGRRLRLGETVCFAQCHPAKRPKLTFGSGMLEFQKPNTTTPPHPAVLSSCGLT